MAAKLIRLT